MVSQEVGLIPAPQAEQAAVKPLKVETPQQEQPVNPATAEFVG